MNVATFRPVHCDACEHQFREHPPENFYLMAFRPDAADFEVTYALCRKCYSQIPGNRELVERALRRAASRCRDYREYSRAYMLKHCRAKGAA